MIGLRKLCFSETQAVFSRRGPPQTGAQAAEDPKYPPFSGRLFAVRRIIRTSAGSKKRKCKVQDVYKCTVCEMYKICKYTISCMHMPSDHAADCFLSHERCSRVFAPTLPCPCAGFSLLSFPFPHSGSCYMRVSPTDIPSPKLPRLYLSRTASTPCETRNLRESREFLRQVAEMLISVA